METSMQRRDPAVSIIPAVSSDRMSAVPAPPERETGRALESAARRSRYDVRSTLYFSCPSPSRGRRRRKRLHAVLEHLEVARVHGERAKDGRVVGRDQLLG